MTDELFKEIDDATSKWNTETLLDYIAARTKRELYHYRNESYAHPTVVQMLENIIETSQHLAFEYYASLK